MGKRDSNNIYKGRSRERVLTGFVVVFMLVLAARLFTLQALRHDEYARFAEDNQLQRERIVAPRGFITDRAGRVLVDNVLHFQIVLPWKTEQEVLETVTHLAEYLPLDTTAVFARFESWRKKNGRAAFPVVRDANKLFISFVRENVDRFPNLRVKSRARRRYRHGQLAAHVLGYVGEAGDADLSRPGEKRYFPGDMVGKTSIELYCEDALRGQDGQKVLEVTASGTVLGEMKKMSIPPQIGQTVRLTIDERLQEYLENLLADKGRSAAVVMDVDGGDILAAVSLPSFDPNEFSVGISQTRLDELFNDDSKPLFNRIDQARYPPASTLKIASTYAILVNELLNPNEILVYCTGLHRFGNRVFRCWRPEGHGAMNLYTAFVQSCDVYFYKAAEIMDVDVLASGCRDFGLGEKTGIELPGEAQGLVPDRDYYDKRMGKGKWTQGHVLNNIIGQGEYLVTVLQVVRMCAAVANGGFLVQPHIIESIGDEAPVAYRKKRVPDLSGGTLRFLRRAMTGVVEDADGTAYWTRIDGFQSAGKTGTAQNPHGENHAWYTAYAPAEDPQIAMAVLVENSGHGGEIAAPIVRDFFLEYFGLIQTSASKSGADETPGIATGEDGGGGR